MKKQKKNNFENIEERNSQLSINFEASEKNRVFGKVISFKDYEEKQLEKKIISQVIRDGKSF